MNISSQYNHLLNVFNSSSLVPIPPALLASSVCTRSEHTADARFRQNIKNSSTKFISKANINENVPVDIDEMKSNML